jgi:hypothetical protein
MVKARVVWAAGIVTLAGSITGVLGAQTPASPTFEVASIKPNESSAGAAVWVSNQADGSGP